MSVSGSVYTTTRVRGLAPWSPQGKTLRLLEQIYAVLVEYGEHLPLMARQVYYRLIGNHGYPKDERSYERLLNALNRGRRAGLIPFESIRDDGATCVVPSAFDGIPDFWRAVKRAAAGYRRDRLEGQPYLVEVWCEAGGMVPQLARVADPFGVAVYSSGGFDSVTVKYDAAVRMRDAGRPTVVLHVGDFDPSGCAIVDSLDYDVRKMLEDMGADDSLTVVRVAVTPEQIERYRLPEAPPKKADRRGNWQGGTVQAEALAPDVLAEELRRALERVIDSAALARILKIEARERARLIATVAAMA
jgi:hypothetical protein